MRVVAVGDPREAAFCSTTNEALALRIKSYLHPQSIQTRQETLMSIQTRQETLMMLVVEGDATTKSPPARPLLDPLPRPLSPSPLAHASKADARSASGRDSACLRLRPQRLTRRVDRVHPRPHTASANSNYPHPVQMSYIPASSNSKCIRGQRQYANLAWPCRRVGRGGGGVAWPSFL